MSIFWLWLIRDHHLYILYSTLIHRVRLHLTFSSKTMEAPGQGPALEQGLAHGDIQVDRQQALGHNVSRGRSGAPEMELEQLETEQLETECKDASIEIFRKCTSEHFRLQKDSRWRQSFCTFALDIIGHHWTLGKVSNPTFVKLPHGLVRALAPWWQLVDRGLARSPHGWSLAQEGPGLALARALGQPVSSWWCGSAASEGAPLFAVLKWFRLRTW